MTRTTILSLSALLAFLAAACGSGAPAPDASGSDMGGSGAPAPLAPGPAAPKSDAPAAGPTDPGAISPGFASSGAVVHLFEWRWSDVAAECETVLGPAGYAAVQISPPSENHVIEGRPWWERYQPVSYQLETRSGDREAFRDMASRCSDAGVDVYADLVINHMADADLTHDDPAIAARFSGRGTAGSPFSAFSYPGLYGYDDFNHCGLTDNDDIQDWDDREQVTRCELVDLADLNTARAGVREKIVAYVQDLYDLGVRGFRVDAARHMVPEELAAILGAVNGSFYLYQEVSNPSDAHLYTSNGAVTDFGYGSVVTAGVRAGRMADLLRAWDGVEAPVPEAEAFVFIDNHDNQRGHGDGSGVLTFKSGAQHDFAVAFMLAQGYGRPRVMSSYAFEGDADGPPAAAEEHTLAVNGDEGVGCGAQWICEHRHPVIAGMAHFAAAVWNSPLENRQSPSQDRIAFSRGNEGFAAFNASTEAWTASVQTNMPAGDYCDVAQGPPSPGGACAGGTIRVGDDGLAAISVPPSGVVGIHHGALQR